MSEEIKKAYKLFNREDLIDDGYERDLDSNIQVFLTTKQMINYMNLQQKVEVKNERIKEEQQEKERYIKFYNGLNIWNKDLQQKVEQLENIRKEIKEYIEKQVVCCKNGDMLVELNVDDLLNILNKGSDKE